MQRTLLIDADDTLWENNIYFERVIAAFLEKLSASGVAAAAAQQLLWETEQRNVKITGYGSCAFCASLHEVSRACNAAHLEPWIVTQERWICDHPIELMPGVAETLPALHAANRVIMLTKGREDEQLGKLSRSGLEKYFHGIEVVFEKDVSTYRRVAQKHDCVIAHTWMIGNSPRSDINPAKLAGLGTVFIPYHTTWQHEIEEIAPHGAETLILQSFAELAQHFVSH
jgi:putative hydrolase of the HAD superfamily